MDRQRFAPNIPNTASTPVFVTIDGFDLDRSKSQTDGRINAV
jgi:hypothetical protein